jgi:hypothetical protein
VAELIGRIDDDQRNRVRGCLRGLCVQRQRIGSRQSRDHHTEPFATKSFEPEPLTNTHQR